MATLILFPPPPLALKKCIAPGILHSEKIWYFTVLALQKITLTIYPLAFHKPTLKYALAIFL